MTIEELIEKTNSGLSSNRAIEETCDNHLNNLLDQYESRVKNNLDFTLIESQGIRKDDIVANISHSKEVIKSILEDYSTAHIAESIKKMKEYLSSNDKLLSMTVDAYQNEDDKHWFRMRNQEKYKKVFPFNEMFHIPFQLRGKVNTQRYSLPGYPCLYISRSIWATWMEMHEPNFSDFCVARLEPQMKFDVLDLRIIESSSLGKYDVAKVLCTIPLVIACSIKVLNPDDNFKPEYILPQLVMLALVDDLERIGCAYTSTQQNSFFKWEDKHKLDNIALPVKMVEEKGLCSKLCSYFKITDATNYEYEMLSETFNTLFWREIQENGEIHEGGKDYANSIFGQLENRLKKKEVKNPNC